MQTLKNYLETMFSSLPNTPNVLKAKDELLAMMEDKFHALCEEGLSEEEALAKVIAEFGSLEEIAAELGIEEDVVRVSDVRRRSVSAAEVDDFLADHDRTVILRSLGIGLCIASVMLPIVFDAVAEWADALYDLLEAIGATGLFALIAIGVGMIVVASSRMARWRFLSQEPCQIDYEVLAAIDEQYRSEEASLRGMLALGVGLCIASVIPPILFDAADVNFLEEIGAALLFLLVAVGVVCILVAAGRRSGYKLLLRLNDVSTVGGNQFSSQKDDRHYSDRTVAAIMGVYWQSVLCLYLSWSFLTFAWWRTWIIWPIAAIIHGLVDKLFKEEDF